MYVSKANKKNSQDCFPDCKLLVNFKRGSRIRLLCLFYRLFRTKYVLFLLYSLLSVLAYRVVFETCSYCFTCNLKELELPTPDLAG